MWISNFVIPKETSFNSTPLTAWNMKTASSDRIYCEFSFIRCLQTCPREIRCNVHVWVPMKCSMKAPCFPFLVIHRSIKWINKWKERAKSFHSSPGTKRFLKNEGSPDCQAAEHWVPSVTSPSSLIHPRLTSKWLYTDVVNSSLSFSISETH